MNDNKPEKSKLPRIAGILIIVLIIIFGKGLLFNGKKDDNFKPEETTAVIETTADSDSIIDKLGDSVEKAGSKVKEKFDDAAEKAESKVNEKLEDAADKVESKADEKLDDPEEKAEKKVKEKKNNSKEKKTTTVSSSGKSSKKSDEDKNSIKDNAKKEKDYKFRNAKLKDQHYEKHGKEMGFSSADDYEKAASDVANSSDALHKKEKEDGDDVYYIEATNDFVVISDDGYIRTYFNPDSGKAYYDKQ